MTLRMPDVLMFTCYFAGMEARYDQNSLQDVTSINRTVERVRSTKQLARQKLMSKQLGAQATENASAGFWGDENSEEVS